MHLASPRLTPEQSGVVIVDHGSRREESNQLLLEVVEAYRRRTDWRVVEPAHMELAEPSIQTAFGRCVEQGAEQVIVFPYFLSPGRHWNEDIPRLAREAAALHGNVPYVVTAPLGLHEQMLAVVDDRIEHCLEHRAGRRDACDLCQDDDGCLQTPAG